LPTERSMGIEMRRKKKKNRAASAQQSHLPQNGSEPKMSAVILKLAEPLLKKYGDTPARCKSIVTFAIVAWNKMVLPTEMQAEFQKNVLDAVVAPDKMAEGGEVIDYITSVIAERRKQYYPHLRKYIVSFDFGPSEGMFALNVASAAIPADR